MSLATMTFYTAKCDGLINGMVCGQDVVENATSGEYGGVDDDALRDWLFDQNWTTTEDGRHFCEECTSAFLLAVLRITGLEE